LRERGTPEGPEGGRDREGKNRESDENAKRPSKNKA